MSVKGLKELQRQLKGIPSQFSDKIIRKANRNAAEPLVSEMHKQSPVGLTGDLADSIGIINQKKSKEMGAIGVGPRRGGGFKGFAGHLVEFGTKRRKTKSGADKGIMPKNPFVSESWNAKKELVQSKIVKELGAGITKYLKRTAPK